MTLAHALADVVDPVLVFEVPLHGLLQTFLELEAGLPAELAVQLR